MEIPKEFGQWMKDYKLQVSEDNVVEPYQHLGLPCYGCELNSGKLELTPSPRPLDESEVGIARSKLKELSTAITILDECSCAYYLYTECVKDMPSCDLQKMLEHVLMVFIIVRLFACGKGYNDAILHCLKNNHNQFRHYWSILERLRNKSIAHTDADPSDCKTHHSEGIDKRITHKWEPSQGTEIPDIVFTDEYAKDSSINVNSILGTVRFSPSDKEAVDKIIPPIQTLSVVYCDICIRLGTMLYTDWRRHKDGPARNLSLGEHDLQHSGLAARCLPGMEAGPRPLVRPGTSDGEPCFRHIYDPI